MKNGACFCKARYILLKDTDIKHILIINNKKGEIMLKKRGGYRGKPKPKLPPHLKRVPVNARIQQWMIDEIKKRGEVGYVLKEILINAGFEYHEPEVKEMLNF